VEAREEHEISGDSHDILTSPVEPRRDRGTGVARGGARAAGKIVQCRDDVRYRSFQEGERPERACRRDDVLREVARRLQTSVRSYDMVGRYGGEEFSGVLTSAIHQAQ